MKNTKNIFKSLVIASFAILSTHDVKAQDIGADLVSKYVWRGGDFGEAAIQPYISTSIGENVEVGVWASYALTDDGLSELDPYISVSLGSFGITATNYTFPGADGYPGAFDFDGLEISATAEVGPVTLLGGYFTELEDMYFEASFGLGDFGVAIGAGDNAYSTDGEFALCNIAIDYSKDLGSVPAFGQLVYNPDVDIMFLVFGVSF
ncbi:MAG: hypothetical protein ACPF99_03430 [Flavobacteriaceae bacterium]